MNPNPQIPHPHNQQEKKFLGSLAPRERELHLLATEMLGSSYFTGKTHGFTKWLKSSSPNTQSQEAK